jgi:peptidyl-prolyl cis-trans isomerase C
MPILKPAFAATCLASLFACSGNEPPATANTSSLGSSDVGTIDGTPIPESLYRRLGLNMLQKPTDDMTEEERTAVMDQLIALTLVSSQGSTDGLDDELNVAAELELRRMQYLASATVERYIENNPPSESELRALYEERIQNLSGTEYKARHILLETEEAAAEVIAQLDAGGDFAALAAEHSTGPTGPDGGDLGWFTPDRMVEPFSNAVLATEVGTYSKTPVRTQFGWHVILVEDARGQQPPGIESMRTELVTIAQRQKVETYVQALRERAQIVLK